MAKVLYSALIDGIRGRAGGVVFSANASGSYFKRLAIPVQRDTALQQTRRAWFGSQGQGWRALTSSQRDDWNTYAAAAAQEKTDSLGQTYYLNGYQWFVSCNTNLALAGRAYIEDAPTSATPSTPTVGTLTITAPGTSSNSQAITVASFGSDDCIITLNWSKSDSKQILSTRNFQFVIAVQNSSLSSTIDLGDLQPIYGVIQADTYWIARVSAQTDEGRRGDYTTASVVAV